MLHDSESIRYYVMSHDVSSSNSFPTAEAPSAPIPVEEFPEHVKSLHSDDDYRFSEEYKVWL